MEVKHEIGTHKKGFCKVLEPGLTPGFFIVNNYIIQTFC